jgi:hypothetical protein
MESAGLHGAMHITKATGFLIVLCLIAGCITPTSRYVESHELVHLTVVFLDQDSMREKWTQITGRNSTVLESASGTTGVSIRTVRGFYDYSTHTIYCEKWNFEVCGHELHHAVYGSFHQAD